ncbi:MAG: STAS domain-containing protein [Cytophagales bacterium]|nr:STAS domain-containing protein [Cytophagales bacterium]
MKIETNIEDNIVFLSLGGEFAGQDYGLQIVNLINNCLQKNTTVLHLIIEMEEISSIDSGGLGVLLTLYNELDQQRGGEVIIMKPSMPVEKMLNVTKLNTVFLIVSNRQEAIEKLNKA